MELAIAAPPRRSRTSTRRLHGTETATVQRLGLTVRGGLEVGIDLYNGDVCGPDSPASDDWWAGLDNYEWVASVLESAEPYLDDNRLFDDCSRNSESFGIGHPERIPAGAYGYQFDIAARPGYFVHQSPYAASMQIVKNNCGGGRADTDCMVLMRPTYPYGPQTEILVNRSRGGTVPSCARMPDKWTAPVLWANDSYSPVLPSPLNYSDYCERNDR